MKLIDPPEQWVKAIEEGLVRPGPYSEVADLEMYDVEELSAINDIINREVRYVPDRDRDIWQIASTQGDCEDISLRKREELIQYGWPIGALRLTICRTERGVGHAILSVITNQGVMLLDNRFKGAKTPKYLDRIGYNFHSRELPGSEKWEDLRTPHTLADLLNRYPIRRRRYLS